MECANRVLVISILCLSLVDISWGQDLMESHEKFVLHFRFHPRKSSAFTTSAEYMARAKRGLVSTTPMGRRNPHALVIQFRARLLHD